MFRVVKAKRLSNLCYLLGLSRHHPFALCVAWGGCWTTKCSIEERGHSKKFYDEGAVAKTKMGHDFVSLLSEANHFGMGTQTFRA